MSDWNLDWLVASHSLLHARRTMGLFCLQYAVAPSGQCHPIVLVEVHPGHPWNS
ncbi:hypothetical protein QM565_16350 [Geitlerinema splendidum]|nr:hypothetical protein [Geitlerinema splendidum]